MTEVFLHVYDVTSSSCAATNNAVLHLNKLLGGRFRLGGVFHSAVEVYDHEEWSFGYSGSGSGLFSCPHKGNFLYSYRETISLGQTSLSRLKVTQILFELGREWRGNSYDLLTRNCNHFCDIFCGRLGVRRLPGWVNRFARVGVAAMEVLWTTVSCLGEAKAGTISAGKAVYQFFEGLISRCAVSSDPKADSHCLPISSDAPASRWKFLRAPSVSNCFGRQEERQTERVNAKRL